MTALDRSARLAWTAPADTGGAQIARYLIQRSESDYAPYTWTTVGSSTTALYLATGLVNGRSYRFRVAAENSAGAGSFSQPGYVYLYRAEPPRTKYPSEGNGSITVAWYTDRIPNLPNLGAPVSVRIERSTPGQTGFTWAGTTTPTAGRFTVGGLINGRLYYIRVGFLYRNGQYGWSQTLTGVPRTVPTAPRLPFIVGGPAAVGIEWAAPAFNGGARVEGYRVQFSFNGTSWTDWAQSGTQWNGLP